jgi:HAD superfamily phosphatase (TIGR01668 family)
MLKNFIPTYHAISVYEIPIDFYRLIGVKNILIDLDNTLGCYRDAHPSRQASELTASLREAGYRVIIISNNKGPRVSGYADNLNVPFLNSARKPSRRRIASFLEGSGFHKKDTILIGDQLLTDVFVANRLGIRVILTEKLVKEDQWTTRFNRMIDKPLRRYLKKKQKLKSWRENYD